MSIILWYLLNYDKLYFQDLKTQLILWAQNTTLLTNIKRKLIGSCSTSNKLGPYFNHVATFGSWSEIHTRTHIHTHIHIHKQSFRERLDDGDFQYGLNVLLIILSSQVEKLDHLKPSTLLQSFRFHHCHQQLLPMFTLTKQI